MGTETWCSNHTVPKGSRCYAQHTKQERTDRIVCIGAGQDQAGPGQTRSSWALFTAPLSVDLSFSRAMGCGQLGSVAAESTAVGPQVSREDPHPVTRCR